MPRRAWDSTISDLSKHRISQAEVARRRQLLTSPNAPAAKRDLERRRALLASGSLEESLQAIRTNETQDALRELDAVEVELGRLADDAQGGPTPAMPRALPLRPAALEMTRVGQVADEAAADVEGCATPPTPGFGGAGVPAAPWASGGDRPAAPVVDLDEEILQFRRRSSDRLAAMAADEDADGVAGAATAAAAGAVGEGGPGGASSPSGQKTQRVRASAAARMPPWRPVNSKLRKGVAAAGGGGAGGAAAAAARPSSGARLPDALGIARMQHACAVLVDLVSAYEAVEASDAAEGGADGAEQRRRWRRRRRCRRTRKLQRAAARGVPQARRPPAPRGGRAAGAGFPPRARRGRGRRRRRPPRRPQGRRGARTRVAAQRDARDGRGARGGGGGDGRADRRAEGAPRRRRGGRDRRRGVAQGRARADACAAAAAGALVGTRRGAGSAARGGVALRADRRPPPRHPARRRGGRRGGSREGDGGRGGGGEGGGGGAAGCARRRPVRRDPGGARPRRRGVRPVAPRRAAGARGGGGGGRCGRRRRRLRRRCLGVAPCRGLRRADDADDARGAAAAARAAVVRPSRGRALLVPRRLRHGAAAPQLRATACPRPGAVAGRGRHRRRRRHRRHRRHRLSVGRGDAPRRAAPRAPPRPWSATTAASPAHDYDGSSPRWLDLGPSDEDEVSNDERSQRVLQAYYDELARGKQAAGGAAAPHKARAALSTAHTAATSRRQPGGRIAARGASIAPTKLFASAAEGAPIMDEAPRHGAVAPMAMSVL